MTQYPEHDKLTAIGDERRETVQEFIDWLLDQYRPDVRGEPGHLIFAAYNQYDYLDPVHVTREKLMAEFFDIDLKRLEAEKDAMLADYLQAVQR